MATKSKNPIKEINTEEIVDKVAINATRVAMVAGVVALGAAFLAGPKTQEKIGKETNQVMDNLRGLMTFFRTHLENAPKQLKD